MEDDSHTDETPIHKKVSVKDYASLVKNGDWRNAFIQALTEADTVYVPDGTYSLSMLYIPSGKTIEGNGQKTIFIPLEWMLFRVEGGAEEEVTIANDISDFSNQIDVTSSEGINTGDMIILKSQRNCMFREDCGNEWTLGQTTSGNKTCFFGEILTVESVHGNRLTTVTPTVFPYYRKDHRQETNKSGFTTRASSTVQKIKSIRNAHLRNFSIKGNALCSEVIRFKWADSCSIENVDYQTSSVPDLDFTVLKITLSRNCKASRVSSTFSSSLIASLQDKISKEYANYSKFNNFKIVGSQDCCLEYCMDNFATHAFNISYSNGGIPSVRCSIRYCHSKNSIWAGVISQQCTPWSTLSYNQVENSGQGVMAGCLWSTLEGNTVKTNVPFATDYYYTHLSRGGTIGVGLLEGYARHCIIRHNTISGFYTGIGVVDGYESLNTFDYADLEVADNTVTNSIQGFYLYKNKYNQNGSRLDISLLNNHFSAEESLSPEEWKSCGIRLSAYSSNIQILSNTLHEYQIGCYMDIFPNYITINDNKINTCLYGLYLEDMSTISNACTVYLNANNNIFTSTENSYTGFNQANIKTFY